tara:strand:- start:113 stop:475 length:363 start_codon:yes stop_codon:yes gene_type:complete
MLLTTTDLFNSFFDDTFAIRKMNQNLSPNYKIETDDDGVTLTMNVPGYNKKLIDISVDGDILVIEGKANSGDTGGFSKRFDMNYSFDVESIQATVVDGVLTLTIPYLEEVKPKKVKVKVT